MTPLELADDILRAGQGRAVMEPVAFSLPNDPRGLGGEGRQEGDHDQLRDARRAIVLNPLLAAIMDEKVTVGPRRMATSTGCSARSRPHAGAAHGMQDGQEVTVHQALGEHYQPIEEGKADITSLYNTFYLRARASTGDAGSALRRLPGRGAALDPLRPGLGLRGDSFGGMELLRREGRAGLRPGAQ